MPKLQNPILILLRQAQSDIQSIENVELKKKLLKAVSEAEELYRENDYQISMLTFRYLSFANTEENRGVRLKVMRVLRAKLLSRKEEFAKFNNST